MYDVFKTAIRLFMNYLNSKQGNHLDNIIFYRKFLYDKLWQQSTRKPRHMCTNE